MIKLRKFTSIVVAFYLLASPLTANAESKTIFELSDKTCSANRLVDIELNITSSKTISAFTFEISYDKNMFEFRSIKAVDNNSIVKSYEHQNFVKAVFLNKNGIDASAKMSVAVIKLKATGQGKGDVHLKVYDCVDSDVDFVEPCICEDATITIKTSADKTKSRGSDKNSNDKSKRSGEDDNDENIEPTEATYDSLGLLKEMSDDTVKYIFIGALSATAFIALLFAAYRFGKHSHGGKNKDKSG